MAKVASQGASVPLLERASPGLLPELSRYVVRHRAEVEALIRGGGPDAGLPACQRHAKVFDGLLSSLFHAVRGALAREKRWRDVSLAAVGSYGRGALAYASDLDVRLLTSDEAAAAQEVAEALLYPLWDSGVQVGHQVVTPDDVIELARTDLPTATSLLDWRQIAGDDAAAQRLLARAAEGLFGPSSIRDFLERLEQRSSERRGRYGGSVYLLEPDVKNGPGGLRDLDVMHWVARARWGVSDLKGLLRIGVLVPREWQPISEALQHLCRVRNLLHLYSGRRSDRLSFERQEQIAADFGYGGGGPGAERMMSETYVHARNVTRAVDMLFGRAMPPPRRRPSETHVGHGLKLTNGEISITNTALLDADPAVALRAIDEAVKRDVPVYAFARDAIMRAASLPSFCERLGQSAEAARIFTRLCTVAQRSHLRAGSVLRELHDVGLLTAMIPEFLPVVGRVHHDIYHVFTVDVHSVAAVDRLAALQRGELAAELPLASRLAAEIARPTVLFFACLLHDVGKDIGGKNHAERGHDMARVILGRLGVSEDDIVEVQHLVQKHLRMYHVATRRDLDEPRTIAEFASEVHGRQGLAELYLLTISDVSTTSPTALTSWKAKMLEELYVATDALLSGSEHRASADHRRAQVWAKVGEPSAFLRHFLEAMPERYAFANAPEDIVRHAAVAERGSAQGVAFEVLGVSGPYAEVAFACDDRPGLLALVTGTFAAMRLPVLSAQIFSFVDEQGAARALDLFWIKIGSESPRPEDIVERLEREFSRASSGELDLGDVVSSRRRAHRLAERPSPAVATEIMVDNRASGTDTLIEITTRDRLGLLFTLADTLQRAGLSISIAKINTEGTQVADVFYVTQDGAKLTTSESIEALRQRILAAIQSLEAESHP